MVAFIAFLQQRSPPESPNDQAFSLPPQTMEYAQFRMMARLAIGVHLFEDGVQPTVTEAESRPDANDDHSDADADANASRNTDSDPAPAPDIDADVDDPSTDDYKSRGQSASGQRSPPLAAADAYIDGLEEVAVTPYERICLAIVEGEVRGDDAMLARLDEVMHLHGDELNADLREDVEAIRQFGRRNATVDVAYWESMHRLAQRYSWFGELLKSKASSSQSDQRREALRPAWGTLIFVIAFFIVGFGLLAIGLAMGITAIVLYATGKLRFLYRPALDAAAPKPASSHVYLEVFVAFIAAFIAISLAVGWFEQQFPTWPSPQLPAVCLVLLLLLLPRFRGVGKAYRRAAMAIQAPRGVIVEGLLGLVGYVATLPILAAGVVGVLILNAIMTRFAPSSGTASHPAAVELMSASWPKVLMLYVLACVWAPVTEELFFRGALLHHLRTRMPLIPAALLVGLIFAAIHPQGIIAVPALAAIGFNFSLIREWRNSMVAPMVAHAVHNATAFTFVMLLFR